MAEATTGELIKTVKQLKELLKDEERRVIMLDSGGFIWRKDYYDGRWLFVSEASIARTGSYGIAQLAYVNIYDAGTQLKKYGPFRIICDEYGPTTD